MRHAVLGAGGVGGLVGAALARAGSEVVLLMRPESLRRYSGRLTVSSQVLGDFVVEVPAVPGLDRAVDVVWITTKATQLPSALSLVPAPLVGAAMVVPLLNGVDHVVALRAAYPRVVAAALRVESTQVAVGQIRQSSPFLRIDLVGEELLATELRAAGFDCRVRDDELSMLWQKLVFLAPLALATAGIGGDVGTVRHDPRFLACQREAVAVAEAEGATVDQVALGALLAAAPDTMRSSMQRDVDAGHPPELDAIAGPVLRGGRAHGLDTGATQALVELVAARAAHGSDAQAGRP